MQGSLCQCHFRHPFRQNYHVACAFLYDWSSVWRSNAYQFTQKTASLSSNQFQEIRGYKVQYFRDKHPRGFQLIGQWKSCARFAYPEALRAAMICVLHSTNDYFPGERQLTWVAAGALCGFYYCYLFDICYNLFSFLLHQEELPSLPTGRKLGGLWNDSRNCLKH